VEIDPIVDVTEPPVVSLEPQPLTAYRPRRKLFRRSRPCDHDWAPRVIGGYRGRICTVCFEVSLTAEAAEEPANGTSDRLIVDLTDAGLAATDSGADPELEPLRDRARPAGQDLPPAR
jgi:hypothetical protein